MEHKGACYTSLREAWPRHSEVALAEERRYWALVQMSETHFNAWNVQSNSKLCSSARSLSIPNQLRIRRFSMKTLGHISGGENPQ